MLQSRNQLVLLDKTDIRPYSVERFLQPFPMPQVVGLAWTETNQFAGAVAYHQVPIRVIHTVLETQRRQIRHAIEASYGQAVDAPADVEGVAEKHEVERPRAETALPSEVVVVRFRERRRTWRLGGKRSGPVAGGIGPDRSQARGPHVQAGEQLQRSVASRKGDILLFGN